MNAEHFHAIIKLVRRELEEGGYVGQIRNLASLFGQLNNSPQSREIQSQVANQREAIYSSILSAASASYTPSQWRDLSIIGVEEHLGDNLIKKIRAALSDTTMTPAVAASKLNSLATELEGLLRDVTELDDAMTRFNIGSEELSAGEVEVEIEVPRQAVGEGLEQLGEEMSRISRLVLAPLEELATGEPPAPIRVRKISSSDFQFYLATGYGLGLALITALEKITNVLVNLRQLSESRLALGNQVDAPKELVNQLKDYIDQQLEKRVDEAARELVESYDPPTTRAPELVMHTKAALDELTVRVENGYGISVRTGDVPQDDSKGAAAVREIREISLRFNPRELQTPTPRELEPPEAGEADRRS